MPIQAPVACTLREADLTQRLTDARALGADALVGVEVIERTAVLRFQGERERVEELVAAETRCCAFLTFSLSHGTDQAELEIRAPEGAEPVLRALVAAVVAGWEGGVGATTPAGTARSPRG